MVWCMPNVFGAQGMYIHRVLIPGALASWGPIRAGCLGVSLSKVYLIIPMPEGRRQGEEYKCILF